MLKVKKVNNKVKSSKKKIIIPIIILVFIVIFDLVFIHVMKNREVDSKADLKYIKTNYEKFEKEVEEFSKSRDEFYANKDNDFFIESMSSRVSFWNDFIKSYGEKIDTIFNISKGLEKKCMDFYADNSTNEKCNKFNSNYEVAINYYITDIKLFNKFAEEYNKNAKDKLNVVDLKYKYIDSNKDGVKTGKLEGDDDAE